MPSAALGGKNSKETGRVIFRMSLIFKLGIRQLPADLARRQSVIAIVRVAANDLGTPARSHQIIASAQVGVEPARLIPALENS